MSNLAEIGAPSWSRDEIIESISEFSTIYAERPIKDNQGGMMAPHMFAVWFITKKLSPDLIVESGIWKGQSTWLLEQACPRAELFSIDLNLGLRKYISERAVYSDRDFSEQDWLAVTDNSLAFFDDHQNAYSRVQQCSWFGFKHIILEDNYPVKQGDCYSLKKAFANAGFEPSGKQGAEGSVDKNDIDSRMLNKNLEVYYEFPPVFKSATTRWGDAWDDESYPTPEPLLAESSDDSHRVFVDELLSYTWICYAKIK